MDNRRIVRGKRRENVLEAFVGSYGVNSITLKMFHIIWLLCFLVRRAEENNFMFRACVSVLFYIITFIL